ncbi:hypothetical protein ACWEOZ_11235 [Actinoplanes sp. NPDC004185]
MSQILKWSLRESPAGMRGNSDTTHRPKHAARGGYTWLHRARQLTLADEILAAARELFDSVDELHYCHDWPYEPAEQRAFDAVHQARKAISRGGEMTEAQLLHALLPVTHEWWPELSPLVADARAAVERIRCAAADAKYGPGHQAVGSAAA